MSKKITKKPKNDKIIVRQEKFKQEIIEQAEKLPILQASCEKTGISRSTIYRWKDEDKEFNSKLKEAIRKGRLLINDYAESKLISSINKGNMTAIIFWLKNNHPTYKEFKRNQNNEDIEPIELMICRYEGPSIEEKMEMKRKEQEKKDMEMPEIEIVGPDKKK